MAARCSADRLDGGPAPIAHAERLRVGAADLADTDAEAHGAVIDAYATRHDGQVKRQHVRAAQTRAADVPLAIAEVGAETARLAATAGHRELPRPPRERAAEHQRRWQGSALLLACEARRGLEPNRPLEAMAESRTGRQ